MPSPTRRRVVTAALLVVASVSLTASVGAPGAQTDATAAVRTARAPLTIVVQMTGMLMLAPQTGAGKPTHIFMPRPPDSIFHYAFIAFRDNGGARCTYRGQGLCVLRMEGWFLEPIGAPAAGSPGKAQRPHGALNFSRGAGGIKLNLGRARRDARSYLTLRGGLASDSCSIATWLFDPLGFPGPEWVKLINVLEWKVSDLQQESVVLTRRSIADPARVEPVATLTPDSAGRVELLVAHITGQDVRDVFSPDIISQFEPVPAAGQTARTSSLREATSEIEAHFRAYYRFLGVSTPFQRFPTDPLDTKDACPITILGLEASLGGGPRGVKTYGCVVGSGDT